jgi:hypothetical protein
MKGTFWRGRYGPGPMHGFGRSLNDFWNDVGITAWISFDSMASWGLLGAISAIWTVFSILLAQLSS